AADRRAVEHHAAGAAAVEHALQAVAAGLDHLAAARIAAGAGDATAALGHLALAHAHGQVAEVDNHAVEHAAAAAHAAGQHRAQVLHHATGDLVVALTGQAKTALALFQLHGAAGHHHEVGGRWHGGRRAHAGRAHAREAHSRHPHS